MNVTLQFRPKSSLIDASPPSGALASRNRNQNRCTSRRMLSRVVAGLILMGMPLLGANVAQAATRTWDSGGPDFNWTTPLNWVGDVAPVPGDDLVFPRIAPIAAFANNDYPADTLFNSITVTGEPYSLVGNRVQLGSGSLTVDASAANTGIDLPFLLSAAQSFTFRGNTSLGGDINRQAFALTINTTGTSGVGSVSAFFSRATIGTGALTVNTTGTTTGSASTFFGNTATIDLGGATLTVNTGINGSTTLNGAISNSGGITVNTAANTFSSIDGIISGAGGLTKTGTGLLTLRGDNTYSGATAVNAGILDVSTVNALGASTGGTTVATGAALRTFASGTISEPLTLNGTGIAPNTDGALQTFNTVTFTNTLTIASATTIASFSGTTLTINGALTGTGRLTYNGNQLIFGGSATNNFSAGLVFNGNRLTMNRNDSFGTLTFNNFPTVDGANQLIINADLIGSGRFDVGGVVVTPGTHRFDANFGSFTFNSPVSDTGTITVTGFGGLIFNSITNTYSGTINAFSGGVTVNGVLAGATIVLNNGSTLSGIGTTGPVNAVAGTVTPFAFNSNTGTGGTLTTGNFSLSQSSNLNLSGFNGTTAGTDFTRLVVNGTVTLGGNLNVGGINFPASNGTSFVLIANDGTDMVNGTFSRVNGVSINGSFPEGTTVSLGSGINARLTYRGGDGNDVALVISPLEIAINNVSTLDRVFFGGRSGDQNPNPDPARKLLSEGDSSADNVAAIFTVTLNAPSTQTVTVNFATADITALAGEDYVATSGTLTFAPGETNKTVTVRIIGDTVPEQTKRFALNLSGATNATFAPGQPGAQSPAQGIGTINDDDAVVAGGTVTIIFTSPREPLPQRPGVVSQVLTRDLSTISGTVVPVPGSALPARVDVFVQRASDNAYFNGTGFVISARPIALRASLSGSTFSVGGPGAAQLRDGDYLVTATAFDAGGNNLGVNSILDTVDLTGPTISIDVLQDGQVVTSAAALATLVGTITDSGSGVQSADVSLLSAAAGYFNGSGFVAGAVLPIGNIASTGTFSLTTGLGVLSASQLPEGPLTIRVHASDRVGNTSEKSITVFVDRQAPTVSFIQPTNGARLRSLPDIVGIAKDTTRGSGIASVQLFIQRRSDRQFFNGTAFTAASTPLSVDYTATTGRFRRSGVPNASQLTPGVYRLTVKAMDRSGRQTIESIDVTIVSTTPVAG